MSLATRIIPTLLCRGRTLVKGKQFKAWRSVGVAAQAVRIHQARGVDELVLLDIAATPEGRGPDLALVEELTAGCFMPLAVGGGVRTVEDVRALLRAGADKVVIRSASPALAEAAAAVVGRQGVIAALDYAPGQTSAVTRAREWECAGAGEILLTSMDRDGTRAGFDLELTRAFADALEIPVIASGGVGNLEHLVDGIVEGHASAVLAASIFHYGEFTVAMAKQLMAARGVEVRL